jgi:choline dehydrogenase-like flavoprotein
MSASPAPPQSTRQERQLRWALAALGVLSAAFIVMYLVGGLLGTAEYPFVVNSTAKDGLFVLLCLLAMADIRRFSVAVVLLIAAHVLLALGLALMLATGHSSATGHTLGGPPLGLSATALALVWMGADLLIAAAFTWLYIRAQRARYGLRYLGSSEYRALAAMAEVLVDTTSRDRPTGEEVASRVDAFLVSFQSPAKASLKLSLLALAYYPLLSLHPPLAVMDAASRLAYVRKRFVTEVAQRGRLDPLRGIRQDLIFGASQLVYLGYYGDPRGAAGTGYVPFSRLQPQLAGDTPAGDGPKCLDPSEVGDRVQADVVIIGSGAAGATLAYELAARGREVLVLERGRHVEATHFSEDEATQYGALYADGALELSTDFRFAVTQGSCVGGSTVVNNGVCFDIPEPVLARWVNGLDSGLDADRLRASFAHLKRWLPIIDQGLPPDRRGAHPLNPGGQKFLDGIEALGLTDPPNAWSVVDANIEGCIGCGYCNIGCRWGKKLSMLEKTLPQAQREFPGRVRILPECAVQRIETDGRRAQAVNATLGGTRSLRVAATTVVLSAGALASSLLLKRSGIGGPMVGKRLGFNIGTPMTGEFPEEIHSERGLQMSHYLTPPDSHGFVLETWFNPVVFQSLVMPGWLEQHTHNMHRYSHMTCVGALVGSESNATVDLPGLLQRGVALNYTPTAADFDKTVAGLKLAGRILLAAGAAKVMPATFAYHEFSTVAELDRLDELVHDDSELWMNSSHPQGGNVLGRHPSNSVVDASFRVHGLDNLYVCDASVFPSSLGVNPQLTVMALAHYAAAGVE